MNRTSVLKCEHETSSLPSQQLQLPIAATVITTTIASYPQMLCGFEKPSDGALPAVVAIIMPTLLLFPINFIVLCFLAFLVHRTSEDSSLLVLRQIYAQEGQSKKSGDPAMSS